MISKFYTKTATVYRLSWTTDENSFDIANEVLVGNITGHLQQASSELIRNVADKFTLSHIFWCSPDSDVKVADTLVIDSERYSVRAIQDNSFVGSNAHLELQLEKEDNNYEQESGS